jgi:hypothetical protein
MSRTQITGDLIENQSLLIEDLNQEVTDYVDVGATAKFTTVEAAEIAIGKANQVIYVKENETFYRYESNGSAYKRDGLYALNTATGGNTRWLGTSGRFDINIADNTYALSLMLG